MKTTDYLMSWAEKFKPIIIHCPECKHKINTYYNPEDDQVAADWIRCDACNNLIMNVKQLIHEL
jgi:phage FluMu protein Com